jgi:large subunit ribosomal protein L32
MAVPKKRKSSSRRDMRRAHWKLKVPGLVECSHCHEYKQPHRVCMKCGYYKGKEVIKIKEE